MSELENLRKQLEGRENDAKLAAEIGKKLLEDNNCLQAELERQSKEFFAAKEALLQENHAFQMKLDHKCATEKNYEEEVEGLKETLQRVKREFQERIEHEYKVESLQLKSKVKSLESEVEQGFNIAQQLKLRNNELQENLKDVQRKLKESAVNQLHNSVSELEDAHAKLKQHQADEVKFLHEIDALRSKMKELELTNMNLRDTLTYKVQELQDGQMETIMYSNGLQKSRNEVQELRVELEMLRFEQQDQKKKGNSLFGEVEDRRVKAEKELITVQTQYEALTHQHERMRQQMHKLKQQLAGFLCYSGKKADAGYMERLQQQLSQARSEVQDLTQSLNTFRTSDHHIAPTSESGDTAGSTDASSEYMKSLLTAKEERFKSLQEQARMKHLLLIAESDKVVQCEQKLHTTERELEQLKANSMKMALYLEDLQIKYEPEKMNKELRQKCIGIMEKIPLDEDAKIDLNWSLKETGVLTKKESVLDASERKSCPENAQEVSTERMTAEAVIASLFGDDNKENKMLGKDATYARSTEDLGSDDPDESSSQFGFHGKKVRMAEDSNEVIFFGSTPDNSVAAGLMSESNCSAASNESYGNIAERGVTQSEQFPSSFTKPVAVKFCKAKEEPGDCKTQ